MRLDEKGLRRDGFRIGQAIRLGDGGEWILPPPMVRFWPAPDGQGNYAFTGRKRSWGPEYEVRLEAFLASENDPEERHLQLLNMAVILLRENYELTDLHLAILLPFLPEDEANDEMWAKLLDLAIGNGPKPMPVGSDAPSLPTG